MGPEGRAASQTCLAEDHALLFRAFSPSMACTCNSVLLSEVTDLAGRRFPAPPPHGEFTRLDKPPAASWRLHGCNSARMGQREPACAFLSVSGWMDASGWTQDESKGRRTRSESPRLFGSSHLPEHVGAAFQPGYLVLLSVSISWADHRPPPPRSEEREENLQGKQGTAKHQR